MERDLELIVEILEALEKQPLPEAPVGSEDYLRKNQERRGLTQEQLDEEINATALVTEQSPDKLGYHLLLSQESGLIQSTEGVTPELARFAINLDWRLTSLGHDFLANLRVGNVEEQVKELRGLALPVVVSTVARWALKALEGSVG